MIARCKQHVGAVSEGEALPFELCPDGAARIYRLMPGESIKFNSSEPYNSWNNVAITVPDTFPPLPRESVDNQSISIGKADFFIPNKKIAHLFSRAMADGLCVHIGPGFGNVEGVLSVTVSEAQQPFSTTERKRVMSRDEWGDIREGGFYEENSYKNPSDVEIIPYRGWAGGEISYQILQHRVGQTQVKILFVSEEGEQKWYSLQELKNEYGNSYVKSGSHGALTISLSGGVRIAVGEKILDLPETRQVKVPEAPRIVMAPPPAPQKPVKKAELKTAEAQLNDFIQSGQRLPLKNGCYVMSIGDGHTKGDHITIRGLNRSGRYAEFHVKPGSEGYASLIITDRGIPVFVQRNSMQGYEAIPKNQYDFFRVQPGWKIRFGADAGGSSGNFFTVPDWQGLAQFQPRLPEQEQFDKILKEILKDSKHKNWVTITVKGKSLRVAKITVGSSAACDVVTDRQGILSTHVEIHYSPKEKEYYITNLDGGFTDSVFYHGTQKIENWRKLRFLRTDPEYGIDLTIGKKDAEQLEIRLPHEPQP